jgi:hypothetical protein
MRAVCGIGTPRGLQGSKLSDVFSLQQIIISILLAEVGAQPEIPMQKVTSGHEETPIRHSGFYTYAHTRILN